MASVKGAITTIAVTAARWRLESRMCMQPEQSNSKRSAELMLLDCDSLGRMVRGLTLQAVAEHFASLGEATMSDRSSSEFVRGIDCIGQTGERDSR